MDRIRTRVIGRTRSLFYACLALCAFVACAAMPAQAQDAHALREAHEAYFAGFPRDRSALLSLARGGNVFAAMMLERTWQLSTYGEVDAGASRHWRDIALAGTAMDLLGALERGGDANAAFWSGAAAWHGLLGQPKNAATAFVRFRGLAEKGNVHGQNSVGYMYEAGEGVERNPGEAQRWYRMAAEQGDPQGQARLASLYEGQGDDGQAFHWMHKAAGQGDFAWAQNRLAHMYWSGSGVAKSKVEAVRWWRKSAEQGFARAQLNLGYRHWYGEGVVKDHAEAVRWWRKSAEQGDADAQNLLAGSYLTGRGVQQNTNQAVVWYRKAAEQGHAEAQNALGYLYRSDTAQSMAWYQKAADQGHADARRKLAKMQREAAAEPETGGLFRSLVGAAVGVAAGKASGASTEQVMGAALKGAAMFNPDSAAAGALGAVGEDMITGNSGGAASAVGGAGGAGGSYPTRPNLATSACAGFTESNYRERALSGGGDQQLYAMCGQAFEYYTMYKRAIAQGYSQADSNRTYAAHEQAARVAQGFLGSHRAN